MSSRIEDRPAGPLSGGETSLEAVLEGGSNTLLLAPAMGACGEVGCAEFLTVDPPAETTVLYVTLAPSPDDRLDAWRTHVDDELPARTGFVDVGDGATSAGSSQVPCRVETVADPADLTGLWIELTDYCAEWGDDRLAVCFHSLSTLLHYAGRRRVFRFLHGLTTRMREIGAVAHYHMDPAAHDERTVNTIRLLFDATVEADGSGGWRVSTR